MRISDWSSDVCSSDLGQPPSTAPTTFASSVRAPSKNTSLNSESPVSWWIGRTSMPGWSIGTSRYEMPLCLATSGLALVRASTKHQSAQWAWLVQTFWPSITHEPSCTEARRSEEHTSELQSLMRNPYAV